MLEYRPREFSYLQNVVEELNQVVGISDEALLFCRVRSRSEFVPDMMSATAGWSNHAIEGAEDSGTVLFGRLRLFIAAAVGHGLAATRLILRIYNVDSQSFEQLEGGYADMWIEHVYIAGDHERDLHRHLTS